MKKLKDFFKNNYKFLIAVILIILLFQVNLPYVVYTPGGLIDLKNRVEIDNSYETSGSFNMSYVSMINGNIPFLLLSYVIPNWDIEKTTDVTYENETLEETLEIDKALYEESINNAIIAAFTESGKEIVISKEDNEVIYISSYSETNLEVGDILLKADGIEITSLDTYKDIVENHELGDVINLVVLRADEEKNISIVVKDDNSEKKTGIGFVTLKEIETDPTVEVTMAESESGPSGGLMLALSIYNSITENDLSKGLKIAGTGTIDEAGNVGEIGGIKYKLLGAIKNDADIFICPADNYSEAKEILETENSNLKLISVSTLKEAIEKLS
ncbi:MAG TPA: PDZ domain-containing protein [Bacilli bacterium]|nr:PDZ domain-containing protein [Bacilli bacterium]